MATTAVLDTQGKELRQMDLNPQVFDAEINTNCVRAAVNHQLARRRQGNAATKNRALVSGTTAKPWKQKGTGRARAGESNSPIWRGGGTAFGPHPHQFGGQLNRKVLQRAIVSCLSSLARDNELVIVDVMEMAAPKTRDMTALLRNLKIAARRILIITETTNVNVALSARNLPSVDVINCDNINTYDLTTHDVVIATSAAIARLEEVYA